jgi:glycosyltransferase involved in cell wall biosynthesis
LQISNKIFLSPHFDDLAFSLSGHLLDWRVGAVINIFSESNYTTSKYKSRYPTILDTDTVSKLRDYEDISFCKQFDLSRVNLGLSEASVRGVHPFDQSDLKELSTQVGEVLIPLLLQFSEDTKPEKIALYCPMGIGGHVDHVATLQAVVEHYQVLSQLFDIYFYEEFPYASNPLFRDKGLVEFFSRFPNTRHIHSLKKLNSFEIEAKANLISVYQSQFDADVSSTFFSIRLSELDIPCESIWQIAEESKKKIALISHTYYGDGSSQALLDAASYWSHEKGWEIDALVKESSRPTDLDSLALAGVTPISSITFNQAYSAVLVNCLANIHVVDSLPEEIPIIIWAHEAETILQTSKANHEDWCRRFRRASLIVFQTLWQLRLYEKFLQGIDTRKFLILANPISTESIKAMRSEHKNHYNIVSVGKLTPLKGCDQLIEAVQSLSKRYSVHCEFIGGLEFLQYLPKPALEILKSSPQLFTLSGHLPRVEAHQRTAKADIFCFPSRSESFSLAPLEAALIGMPVVLNNLPVYQYIGWKSEENCLIYDENAKNGLEKVIERLILDPRLAERLALQGQSLAKLFSCTYFHHSITQGVSRIIGGFR